jgi:hypothetical protein
MDSVKKRQEEATSKETVSDLEEEGSLDGDEMDNSDAPSPDGAFDEANELKDADPT